MRDMNGVESRIAIFNALKTKLNHYRLEAAKHSKECPSLQRDVVFIVRLVRIDMAIDVGIDHLIGDVSTGRTEKSSAPKMPTPIPFANLWKFLLNLPRAAPFGNLHKVTDRNMRWNLRKNYGRDPTTERH